MKKIKQKKSHSGKTPVLQVRQITVILGILVLLFGVFGFIQRRAITHSVLGASVFRGLYAKATISLPSIPTVVSYNVYYKAVSDSTFTNAMRSIAPAPTVTLLSLKKGIAYEYKIAGLDASGREIWFSPISPITNMQPM
jgi:hypothetical protein